MKKHIIVLVVLVLLLIIVASISKPYRAAIEPTPTETPKIEYIHVTSPQAGETIHSPVTITGEARGTWYFEASFPIIITDWDGRIIGEGHAEAQSDWMTENFVPFTASVTYLNATSTVNKRGTVILKKDNPSGLPENDAAVEIPVILN